MGLDPISRSRDRLLSLHSAAQPEKSSKQPASLPSISSPQGLVLNPEPQKVFVFHFLDICKSCSQLRFLSTEGQQGRNTRNL